MSEHQDAVSSVLNGILAALLVCVCVCVFELSVALDRRLLGIILIPERQEVNGRCPILKAKYSAIQEELRGSVT